MTEFKVGQEVECVGTNYYWHITTGKIYTVLRIANIKTIQIKNDLGYKEYYHGGLFKPVFIPEYFSALNLSEAEKYIGKVMEFEDGNNLAYESAWKSKYTLINMFYSDDYPFGMGTANNSMQFCRTCPETFETEGETKVTTKPKDVKSILHGDLVEHLVTKKCNCQEMYFKINIETKMKNIKHWFCPAHGYKKI